MKKIKIIVPFLLMIMLSTSVLAEWSASRMINGNDVTITITPGDGFDTFTVTEIVTGATIVDKSFPVTCGLANNKLTCDFDGTDSGTISYKTIGAGSASGSVAAINSDNFAKDNKQITGDVNIVPLACDATHPNSCLTQEVCVGVDNKWYINTCYDACPAGSEDTNGDNECTKVQLIPQQQPNQALLDAISKILQGQGTTLDKLASIAAELFGFFK